MLVRVSKTRDGVEYVYLVEAYRDAQGRSRQRIVERHGRLDVLLAADPDALAGLRQRAKDLTATRQARRGTISYDTTLPSDGAAALNAGWWLAEAVLGRLGIGRAVRAAARKAGWDIDVAAIVNLLVCSRVVWPCSKKATTERAGHLLGAPAPDLGQVYQALDHIAGLALTLQQAASQGLGRSKASLGTVDYDVTNYFFHIDSDDENPLGKTAPRGQARRQRGHSKENRPDPIIQLGLFLDSDGIPISYRLFDGNVPDTSTLPAVLGEFKHAFGAERIVVVADKAMNTAPNLGALAQNGDGWIVSASARTATKALREWLLDPTGWTGDHQSRTKSMIQSRGVPVTMYGVEGVPLKVTEKIVARWSADAAARDRHTREEILARAETLAADETRYRASSKRGIKKYITAETIDPATGELLTGRETQLSVDHARAQAEAQFDGYQLVRTSETTLTDQAILDRYHQLWRIEQTFRVSKTDLHTRPVYVRTPAHIEAHFAVCFLALLVTRLLERWTGLPAGQLLHAVRHLEAIPVGDAVYRLIRPTNWDIIDHAVGAGLDQTWATLTELRTWKRNLTHAAKTATFTTPTNT
ncbi:MAG: IS1634 family transposase [Acidobacteriota bacterium]|nr:IS1634 family transposase [Acidobacteriota bacterium]